MTRLRTLVLVLGDQLDLDAAAFDGFDPLQDAVWMAEAEEESRAGAAGAAALRGAAPAALRPL